MIDVINVKDRDEGNLKAHDILAGIVDLETLLALSGGTSPDYKKMLVKPGDIIPGAICIVDDRYGKPFHKDSTEQLLKKAGVKKFADDKCIESHKILKGKSLEETGEIYAQEMEDLFEKFPKRVGVMGVGTNLHTGGIFPNSVAARAPKLALGYEVEDKFKKRVTITFRALSEFTNFVILMFGKEKKEALVQMLDDSENDMHLYPAIFYRKAPVKAFLITDIDL